MEFYRWMTLFVVESFILSFAIVIGMFAWFVWSDLGPECDRWQDRMKNLAVVLFSTVVSGCLIYLAFTTFHSIMML